MTIRSIPRSFARGALAAGLLACLASAGHAQLLGPSAYSQTSDSPFAGVSFGSFYLEDFEDHLLSVPGVSADAGGVTSVVFGPQIHDSVDADDGAIDGSGLQGDDWFAAGSPGVTWSFDSSVLGSLPTHAGIVWTDGVNDVLFEAFDENGVSLGTLGGAHANGSFNGETDDDRFYGAIHAGGISKIHLQSGAGGGIEMDHLQYGGEAVPEPSTIAALLAVTTAMLHRRRRS